MIWFTSTTPHFSTRFGFTVTAGLEFAASMGTGQRGAARRGAPDQRRGAGARRLQQRAAGGGGRSPGIKVMGFHGIKGFVGLLWELYGI